VTQVARATTGTEIDETRAQVLIAQGNFKEAEAIARRVASALAKGGHQGLLADALNTQGIALARSGSPERAQLLFQDAVEAALEVNARNKAGLAALTMIEEVRTLSPSLLRAAYNEPANG
jgi:ATP/maltotriose-dependent transcriptional regulator MalT